MATRALSYLRISRIPLLAFLTLSPSWAVAQVMPPPQCEVNEVEGYSRGGFENLRSDWSFFNQAGLGGGTILKSSYDANGRAASRGGGRLFWCQDPVFQYSAIDNDLIRLSAVFIADDIPVPQPNQVGAAWTNVEKIADPPLVPYLHPCNSLVHRDLLYPRGSRYGFGVGYFTGGLGGDGLASSFKETTWGDQIKAGNCEVILGADGPCNKAENSSYRFGFVSVEEIFTADKVQVIDPRDPPQIARFTLYDGNSYFSSRLCGGRFFEDLNAPEEASASARRSVYDATTVRVNGREVGFSARQITANGAGDEASVIFIGKPLQPVTMPDGTQGMGWIVESPPITDEKQSVTFRSVTQVFNLDGDIDGNDSVDRSDRIALALALGQRIEESRFNPRADLNTDGMIDQKDWLFLNKLPQVFDCIADIASEPQTLGPDGQLTAADFIVFYNRFFAGSLIADIASAAQVIGHDGQLTADDIIVFNNRFFAGCD